MTESAGWPHAVVTSTSGRTRPTASTAANVCPRRLSPSPSRADDVGLLGTRRPLESTRDRGPSLRDLWPNAIPNCMMTRGRGRGPIALVLLFFTHAVIGFAQQQTAPPGNEPPPKVSAPPLFPRHRRGLYRNVSGLELIDATPQSPPLDTDDPGVPDKGAYEINIMTRVDYVKDAPQFDLLSVDANYGFVPVIGGYKLPSQIKFEWPMAAARDSEGTFHVGFGAATMGIKLNFYRDEHRGIGLSIYPQLQFAVGEEGAQNGLTEPGQTLILPLLVAREFHDFTFVFNGSVEQPVHDPERHSLSTFGGGFGRALTRKVAAMIELRTESSLAFQSDRLVYIDVGLIHGVRNIVVYGNVGHSLFADDGVSHTYAGFGMKLMIDPAKKTP